MSQDTIPCEVCGREVEFIHWRHLQTHSMTLAQYKEQFPNSPTYSETAKRKRSEASKRSNANRRGKPRSAEVKRKIASTKRNNPKEAWNKGITMSDDQKAHLSAIKRQQYESGEVIHWNTGNKTPDEVKSKISATALSQDRTFSEESKNKRSETMKKMRDDGWVHPSHRPEVIDRRRDATFEKYGVDNFMQHHLKPSVLSKLNDPDWLYAEHVDSKKPITQICRELGLHWKNSNAMIKSRLQKFNIPQQYDFSSSYPERELRSILDGWGVKYIGNDRTQISPKELDIYIPEHQLAIEYCGLMWHSDAFVDKNYHKAKYDMCKERGIRLVTIFEDEWIHNRDVVVSKIQHLLKCGTRDRVFARQCSLIHVPSDRSKEFLNDNHIQGNGPGSISVGLEYDGELVAVAKYRDDGNGDYLLNRFATSKTVVGGFTKLERFFDKEYNPSTVTTFADLRWSEGDLYEQSGYTLVSKLRPDYAYIDKDNFTRIHKFNFRHSRLKDKLTDYDPNLSESENCANNGWHKIYNCGLLKYIRSVD